MHTEDLKILIIDDHPEEIRVLREILKAFNYKIRGVTEANRAIEAIKRDLPNLILLDTFMPEINGFEICRVLKEDDDLKKIPIIFIRDTKEDIKSCYESGGVDYITKPFIQQEVISRVKTALTLTFLCKNPKNCKYSMAEDLISMITPKWRETITTISILIGKVKVDTILEKLSVETINRDMDSIYHHTNKLAISIEDFSNYYCDKKILKKHISIQNLLEDSIKSISKTLRNSNIKIQIKSTIEDKIETYPDELQKVIIGIVCEIKGQFIDSKIEKPTIFIKVDENEEFFSIVISDNRGVDNKSNLEEKNLYLVRMVVENRLNGKIKCYNSDIGLCYRVDISKGR